MVLPIVDEIAVERKDVFVAKVNVNDNPDLAKEFGIFSIPTLIVMKDGRIVNKASGAKNKAQILSMIEK